MPKVKDKERILKAAKVESYLQGVPIRLSHYFSKETLQSRSDWQEAFKEMKSKDLQPRSFYLAKASFTMEGQIKCFPDKVKVKEYFSTKTSLH